MRGRTAFRTRCPKGLGGSSPPSRTPSDLHPPLVVRVGRPTTRPQANAAKASGDPAQWIHDCSSESISLWLASPCSVSPPTYHSSRQSAARPNPKVRTRSSVP